MTTHTTLEAARAAAPSDAVACAKITHRTAGECYINLKCDVAALKIALKLQPSRDIVAIHDQVADYRAERIAAERIAAEASVPGITEMLKLATEAATEAHRYDAAFRGMMEDEHNDGARPPRPENRSAADRLAALKAANPRATLYLAAKRQAESGSWADNTGKAAAGRAACEILRAGGTIEAAEAALARRNTWVD